MRKQEGLLLGVVANNVPVGDFLKLRSATDRLSSTERMRIMKSAKAGEVILHGKPASTYNPVMIAARGLATGVELERYLPAREIAIGQTIEELTDQLQADGDNVLITVEKMAKEREGLVAEQKMLKTIFEALAQ